MTEARGLPMLAPKRRFSAVRDHGMRSKGLLRGTDPTSHLTEQEEGGSMIINNILGQGVHLESTTGGLIRRIVSYLITGPFGLMGLYPGETQVLTNATMIFYSVPDQTPGI